jgi:hypothetical protein
VGVVLNSGEHSQECTDWGGVYDGFWGHVTIIY